MKIKQEYLLAVLATSVLILVTTNPMIAIIPALFTSLTGLFILFILFYIILGEIFYTIVFVILIISIYRGIKSTVFKEGFSWTCDSLTKFKKIQKLMNPQKVFDTNVIQTNANQNEVNHFNRAEHWPWSIDTIDLYTQALDKNPYSRNLPAASVLEAKQIYNEQTIRQILSNQAKEGQFLLHGITLPEPASLDGIGSFGISSGLDNIRKKVIQCSPNKKLQLKEFVGYDGITGVPVEKTTNIADSDVENTIPGFSFVKAPCNPCAALEGDYTCPFNLHVSNDSNGISDIWKKNWNL